MRGKEMSTDGISYSLLRIEIACTEKKMVQDYETINYNNK